MENAISLLTILPGKKDEVNTFVSKVLSEIDAGIYNPLELFVRLNALTKAMGLIKEAIESQAQDEFSKYGEKSTEVYGANIQQAEAGVRYIFDKCGDVNYDALILEQNKIAEKLKKQEDFLKTIPVSGIEVTDENTGEICRIFPPAKSSKTILKIILK